MKLFILPEKFTVCRLRSDAEFPYSVMHAGWWNITRTDDELSIVCPESYAPEEAEIEKGVLKENPILMSVMSKLLLIAKSCNIGLL